MTATDVRRRPVAADDNDPVEWAATRPRAGEWSPGVDGLGLVFRPQTWARRAACRDAPIEVFFAGPGSSWREARRLCDGCPVRLECLDAALVEERGANRSQRHGFRGGETPGERARLGQLLDELGR